VDLFNTPDRNTGKDYHPCDIHRFEKAFEEHKDELYRKSKVVPLTNIRQTVQLAPNWPEIEKKEARLDKQTGNGSLNPRVLGEAKPLTSANVLEECDYFWLNRYLSRHSYLSIY
jgi:hypothetical protein